jgi:hypothetical protein
VESNPEKKDIPSKPELPPKKDNSATIRALGKTAIKGVSQDKPNKRGGSQGRYLCLYRYRDIYPAYQ